MDSDRHAIVRRLFALVTEILEHAHETSVQGQSPNCTPSDFESYAAELTDNAVQVSAIAAAVLALGTNDKPRKQAKQRKRRLPL